MVTQSPLDSIRDDLVWFFDIWNVLGALGVTIIAAAAFKFGGYTPQSVLVAITALYAFFSFNQMRESKFNQRPSRPLAVRPHFQKNHEDGTPEIGLKNFGEGPALNLRLKAVLRTENEVIDRLTISSKDWNHHLEEDDFLSLVSNAPKNSTFQDLTDTDNPVFENYGQKFIEFYYTFEARDGTQHPLGWSEPTELEMSQVVSKSASPRTIELDEIYAKCA